MVSAPRSGDSMNGRAIVMPSFSSGLDSRPKPVRTTPGCAQLLAELISAEQQRAPSADLPPAALAVLLTAAADGLMLNVLADPELDISPAIAALNTLLTREPRQRAPSQ